MNSARTTITKKSYETVTLDCNEFPFILAEVVYEEVLWI